MGSFAYLWREKGASVPPEKYDELDSRMLLLFRASGMMEVCCRNINGRTLTTISPPVMHSSGISVTYNYFEDAFRGGAGYDLEGHFVWSRNPGVVGQFNHAVIAAYTLEGKYTDGITIPTCGGFPKGGWPYTGWLNYLFDEKFPDGNPDAWKVFQALHDLESTERVHARTRWNSFLTGLDGRSSLEVYACMNGVDKVLSGEVNDDEHFALRIDDAYIAQMREIREWIRRFRSESALDRDTQLEALVQAVRDSCGDTGDSPPVREKREGTDAPIQRIRVLTGACGCHVITVLLIAEAYSADFWDIWEKVRDAAEKRAGEEPDREPAEPIPTTALFLTEQDNMVFFWTPGGDIRFSEQMSDWFAELREKYLAALKQDLKKEITLPWILDLIEFVEYEYFRVFTFDSFLRETIRNLGDERYLALWKVCEDLARDPELLTMADKLFETRDDQAVYRQEHSGVLNYPRPERKPKEDPYWMRGRDILQNNPGRAALKRFMALTANPELRKAVFGF